MKVQIKISDRCRICEWICHQIKAISRDGRGSFNTEHLLEPATVISRPGGQKSSCATAIIQHESGQQNGAPTLN
jgi:hypothetical protein